MSRFIILFVRYVAAMAVSCVVSFTLFPLALYTASPLIADHPANQPLVYVLFVPFVLVGFCGVFAGTLCLRRDSRRFGSVFLLCLGLAFYIYLCLFDFFFEFYQNTRNPLYLLPLILPLTVGGLSSVVLSFLIFRRKPPNI
jgi:cyanate permease